MRLYILVPSMEMLHADFMVSIAALNQELFNNPPPGLEAVRLINERASLIVQSREFLLLKAVREGATHVLWLDSDMKFPPDIVHRLAAHKKPLIGCNYAKRIIPSSPTGFNMEGKPLITGENQTGIEAVRSLGFGCVLMDLKILKDIPRPWFDAYWVLRGDDDIPETEKNYSLVGEDLYFFWNLLKNGTECYVDHDLSKEIIHVGTFEYSNKMCEINFEVANEDT